jgi:uncharacterized protein YoxC
MISEDEVEKALATAQHELAHNSGLSWIKKSALSERAYHLGLLIGLSGVADEELLKSQIVEAVVGTMWQRKADDTFLSTKIGQNHQKLMDIIRTMQPVGEEFIQVINRLEQDIDWSNRKWQVVMSEVHDLMERVSEIVVASKNNTVKTASNHEHEDRHELHKLLGDLEALARQVALLEIDHNLQSRFEE